MEPAEWHKSTWVNMNKHDQCFFWTSLQIQKPSRLSLFLSLFCKVLLPLLSFHIFATISLDFLVWATSCHILPRHATTGPLLAGWVSIKWRGLTPHLHHNTIALWESRGIGAAGVRTSTQKPSQLSLFCKLLLPLLSFHNFATISLDFLVWATSARSCHDWALAGRVGLYKMEGSNPAPAP